MTKAPVTQQKAATSTADILADFGRFLRLHTADGDESPQNDPKLLQQRGAVRGLVRGARHKSANVTEDDIATYGRELVAQYEMGTVAVKLAAIPQLYEAAVWRGLRQDNPDAGLKAPVEGACRPIGRREVRQKAIPREGQVPQGLYPPERSTP
jgi:hypothetical protein